MMFRPERKRLFTAFESFKGETRTPAAEQTMKLGEKSTFYHSIIFLKLTFFAQKLKSLLTVKHLDFRNAFNEGDQRISG